MTIIKSLEALKAVDPDTTLMAKDYVGEDGDIIMTKQGWLTLAESGADFFPLAVVDISYEMECARIDIEAYSNERKLTPAYIGLDIETTGLDPQTDQILEVGLGFFDENLQLIKIVNLVVDIDCHHPAFISMDPVVVRMHQTSHLTSDMLGGIGYDLEKIEQRLMWLIDDYDAAGLPMLGSSVSFDRSFLAVHMPNLLKKFSHQSIDATSVKFAVWTEINGNPPSKETINDLIIDDQISFVEAYLQDTHIPEYQRTKHRAAYDVLMSAGLIKASTSLLRRMK